MKREKAVLPFLFAGLLILLYSCSEETSKTERYIGTRISNTLQMLKERKVTAEEIIIEKELLYEQYTLEDKYPYKDTVRRFQWDKIKEKLAHLETTQLVHGKWGILQNYRNGNGEAPLVRSYKRNEYKRVADTIGVERFQGIPLYLTNDTVTPERYGRDGALIKIWHNSTSNFIRIETTDFDGEWLVPKRYVKVVSDTVTFRHAIIVDRYNENIATLEKVGKKWLVRSMNPATTGLHKPPYQQETPLGMFVIQEKKYKMFFLVDGTTRTGGFAPYANRFINGGYIHGIPVNAPRTTFIEYSASLGTTPRSHMCVRNATSHAKFVYDNFPALETIVFVIE
ncbi:hypothetical protein M2451_002248 [Dysgonomonas sp. PFB1-18]|uniref:L,D-transpeptidase n=1 Tax=unclassified Dysgonomonas TaxID=2630389 RepID=UPI002475F3D5|nr:MULTISPECIES: L,D-transpeptidase [unclassified Dysgonomonas]MDH6309877.1 hypothetical protein [Dysgonomonas sp. PF1-14]MDH6339421.1 hypothetical protein [Dysgonomonas sp. PF1-16]MDH6380920.1 hypothetical protein [Dysgonomonas sp. PFB1-18]MDH6397929.1 hypothetical protein [Dysgonomonas sp. PF1-23]